MMLVAWSFSALLMIVKLKLTLRLLLGLLFIVAGTLHFIYPRFYLAIMPPVLPYHLALVYVSGFFEIIGGVGMLIPAVKRFAGYGLIALLIAVFPANIQMLINEVTKGETVFPQVLLWLRLPLQIVLIALVWWATQQDGNQKLKES